MRRVVGIFGVCLAVSVVWGNLLAESPETTPESKPDTEAAEEHQSPLIAEEVRQRLHEPITLKLDQVPLSDALVEILRKRHLDYWMDAAKFEKEGISLDAIEVTCDVKNVSIRALLKRILGQADLGWVCDDTGILSTTHTVQINSCFPRIYDVGDLLELPKVDVTAPSMPNQEVQFGGGGAAVKPGEKSPEQGQVSAAGGVICASPGTATTHTPRKLTPEEKLIIMVQTAAGGPPHCPWMETDGEGGTVNLIQTSHAKLLVIRQNELAHAEIENLLNELISHQHAGEDDDAAEAPAEKTAARKIVRPKVRIVAKQKSR